MRTIVTLLMSIGVLVAADLAVAQQWWGEHVPANGELYVGRPELWRWRTNSTMIFNGADYTGWSIRGDSKWTVENGAMVGRPGDGNKYGLVVSDQQYDNFVLTFQFQIEPDPHDTPREYVDSGVFFRLPPGFTRPDKDGFEMELPAHDDVEEPVGTIRHVARAYRGFTHFNFWNDGEILCNGDYIRVTLNGQIASETFSRRSMQGYLAFQHQRNGVVRFRNIQLQELPASQELAPTIEEQLENAPGQFVSLFNGRDLTGWSTPGPNNRSQWHVEDGAITLSEGAGSGNLVHEGKYEDFILKLKFFMPDDGQSRDGNSGIFIRGAYDGRNNGIEAQIENMRDHSHWNPTGSIYDIAQALPYRFNYNDWNDYSIYVKDDRMKVYLNGHMTAAAMLPMFAPPTMSQTIPGHIKIQSHAPYYKLQIKDVMLKEVR